MKLKSLLWVTPFLSFLIGYFTFKFIFYVDKKIRVPIVIGLQLKAAVKILSDNNLNTRVISEKIDDDLPDGTIISQTPSETAVKQSQSVYLIISKKPNKKIAPSFLQKEISEIKKNANKNGIKIKSYAVPNNQKENLCIAQFPQPNIQLENNYVTVYLSDGNKKKVIFPDLRGLELEHALEFLNLYSIKPSITAENENSKEKTIIDQRPLAGSIIDLEKINVQLKY